MNKKLALATMLGLSLCLTSAIGVPSASQAVAETAFARSDIKVLVHGRELSLQTPPSMAHGTTLVPAREIAEALKAKVTYNEASSGIKTVTIERDERKAVLTIGNRQMTANGRNILLPVAPYMDGKITMVPVRAISEALGEAVLWDSRQATVSIEQPPRLPAVGNGEKLLSLLKTIGENSYYGALSLTGAPEVMATAEFAARESDAGNASAPDHSTTNVQVAGVDEADWAKTDGRFIYQISGSRVVIANIAEPSRPSLAAVLHYEDDQGFTPLELYVDENRLIVIGQQFSRIKDNTTIYDGDARQSASFIRPIAPSRSSVKTAVYSLDDAGKPTLTRELEQEGSYLSSRKIGGSLYIVTNKYNSYIPMYDLSSSKEAAAAEAGVAAQFEPFYSDSAISDNDQLLKLDQVHYFPEPVDSSMLLVGAVDLDQAAGQLQVSAFLGSGSSIYASEKHLYVALSSFKENRGTYEQTTRFHKFRLDYGEVVYIGEGSVPGQLLNQYSMDEHKGYLRVALTNGDMWSSEGSSNNVYVLDERLATVGKLEGLAPGEKIYSARFIGDRAYMVTFRNVDPLFAIDLRNPTNPNVLGLLKIPGYSDYLHPYDEHHLIGFGKDTVEMSVKGGASDDIVAFDQGMKIALFDVTDVSQPKEKFKEIIGDRGTSSELLYNHKALLFSKDKNLLAFPVNLYELPDPSSPRREDGFPEYGHFTYQGAYVYGLDLEEGFTLRGRISHMTKEDLLKSGQYSYANNQAVRRILYAGDTLYTLSDAMLKANGLNRLEELGQLNYPARSVYDNGFLPEPVITPAIQ